MPVIASNYSQYHQPVALRQAVSPQFSGWPFWRKSSKASSPPVPEFVPTLSRIPDPEANPTLKALVEAMPPLPHLGHLLQAVSDYTEKFKLTSCHSTFYDDVVKGLKKVQIDLGSIEISELVAPFKALVDHGWVTRTRGGGKQNCHDCFKPVITDAGKEALALFNTWLNWPGTNQKS
jgi:hypothetical protein